MIKLMNDDIVSTDQKILTILERLNNRFPNAKTELEYNDNYTLLVAVILSAQSTDVSVNQVTRDLFKIADTPEKMVTLGEEGIRSYIKRLGLANTKARNIFHLSKILVESYNSNIPETFEQLIALPGVGRKTANVVLNCAFGQPLIAVDTHIFRVANRIGLVKASNPLKTELALLQVIPPSWQQSAHILLVLHGRYICKARKPLCHECSITDLCEFYKLVIK